MYNDRHTTGDIRRQSCTQISSGIHTLCICFCTFYYSHTQESNAKILCSGLVDVADSCSCAEMKEPAKRVAAQFTKALTLFGKCHNLYNGSTLSQKDIDDLGK